MKRFVIGALAALLPLMAMAQSMRNEVQLAEGWRFSLESEQMKTEGTKVAAENYNDASWEVVAVPHDWAIKGPFDEKHDSQVVMEIGRAHV